MSMYRGRKFVLVVLAVLIVVSCTGWPAFAENEIVPQLSTNMQRYIQNDIVNLSLKLTGIQAGDRTNSVTFEIQYDGSTFELLNNDLDSAVENGYIPFTAKFNLGAGASKKVHITYVDMSKDIDLQEGSKVFTAKFKVKSSATAGTKTFRLKPVDMLDSSGNVYNIANPKDFTVEVTNDAVVEGNVAVYLGDAGTGLNDAVLQRLNQTQLNETFKNLKFTLKHDDQDTGTEFKGSDVFIPDENGNLAVKDVNNQVRSNFRVYTADTANTKLTVDGVGYLAKAITVSLNGGNIYAVNTPVELYPGDLGRIVARQIEMSPDGQVNNVDFSAWLRIYKDYMAENANVEDKLRADFTKDGNIDNVDFSLWMASYKKLLQIGEE